MKGVPWTTGENSVKFYEWAEMINEVDRLEGWYTLLNCMDP